MTKDKALWDQILEQIRAAYGEAVIAGGAIRDAITDREVKDLDIYVPAATFDELFGKSSILPQPFNALGETEADVLSYLGAAPEIVGVLNFAYVMPLGIGELIAETIPVQIIGINLPVFTGYRVVETFDYGISRVWYDGEGVVASSDFLADLMQHQLTLIRSRIEPDSPPGAHRLKKLREKFPGFVPADARPAVGVFA